MTSGVSRERQRGKKEEEEEAELTLSTSGTTAREEGARGGRIRDADGRPAVKKTGTARAARALPRRFLLPGGAGGQGEDNAPSGGARRASQRLNRRRTIRLGFGPGEKQQREREVQ